LLSCKGIAEGVENSNYLLHTERGAFILTLYEKRVDPRRPALLPRADGAPGARGFTCPHAGARARRQGAAHAGRPAGGDRHLPGRHVAAPHADALRASATRWPMHLAGSRTSRISGPTPWALAGWRALWRAARRADEVRRARRELIQPSSPSSRRTGRGLPAGVIHADLFPTTSSSCGDRLSGLIDFYFACNDLLAYDVAICLNAWCFEPDNSFNATKARALLQAYERCGRSRRREIAALPLLARGSALRFLLTRLYDWLQPRRRRAGEAARTRWNTSAKLRFHQRRHRPGAYGIL
jgi:homoserine kinase type II